MEAHISRGGSVDQIYNRFQNIISQYYPNELDNVNVIPDPENPVEQEDHSEIQEEDNEDFNNSLVERTEMLIEGNAVVKWLTRMVPFVLLLLLVFAYQHKIGLLIFGWQVIILVNCDYAVKNQASLKERRRVSVLFCIIGVLISNIVLTFSIFSSEKLWTNLIFRPNVVDSTHHSFIDSFFSTVISDFVISFIAMISKSIAIATVGQKPPFNKRGILYGLIETVFAFYRVLAPVPVWFWYFYLFDTKSIFTTLMAGLYLTFKIPSISNKIQRILSIGKAMAVGTISYGREVHFSDSDVENNEHNCVICLSQISDGIVLECGHTFCEECISQWFSSSHTTCPTCRAVIPDAQYLNFTKYAKSNLIFQFF